MKHPLKPPHEHPDFEARFVILETTVIVPPIPNHKTPSESFPFQIAGFPSLCPFVFSLTQNSPERIRQKHKPDLT